ncbi:MAG: DNA polymerase III subunit delta [Sterolibacteriaceae bacterium]|nr:DNA polymerase III subunit delta [Candidatus Methylophosphatis haderslevensis]
MNLRPDQLAAHLAKPLAPLYVLHGDEPLLVLEAADAIRAAARRQGFTEREVLVVNPHFKWDTLTLAAGNLSLFGDAKLIDLRIPTGKPGRDGGGALQRYCANLGAGIVTLVTLPQLDWTTRKSAWFVALGEAGVTLELNAPPLAQLPAWLSQRLARQKQSAPDEALAFIAQHVEGNLLAAHQELQKLGLLHGEGPLTLDQVREAVLNVARYDIDKLRSALLEGDPARCARLLDGLRGEGTATPLVLWAFSQELHALAAVRAGLDAGQPVSAALKSAGVFGPRQQPISQSVQRRKTAGLQIALLQAARIDRMIKGLTQGDVWDEFLQLALRLSSGRTAKGTAR